MQRGWGGGLGGVQPTGRLNIDGSQLLNLLWPSAVSNMGHWGVDVEGGEEKDEHLRWFRSTLRFPSFLLFFRSTSDWGTEMSICSLHLQRCPEASMKTLSCTDGSEEPVAWLLWEREQEEEQEEEEVEGGRVAMGGERRSIVLV